MAVWLSVWILVLPFALLNQPAEAQLLLGVAAAALVIGRRFGSAESRINTSLLLVTPLHITACLVGNHAHLPLAVVALVAPLAMAG